MARHRGPLIPLLSVAALYALALFAWTRYRRWTQAVVLDADQAAYYHYEFVNIRLRARDPALIARWKARPPEAVVLREGRVVTTVAGIERVRLVWDAGRRAFVGRWPCPWNAPDGEYAPALPEPGELRSRLKVGGFRIRRRRPKPLPRRFVALTLEDIRPYATMKVRVPDGSVRDWRGLLDWVKFVEADAFWVLAGQTPGPKAGQVWVPYNLGMIPLLARECEARGIAFGVYAMCYLTMSKARLSRYEYALEVENGRTAPTRAISLRDPNRPGDVADFLKRLRDVPGVDYLGLDYIRNALGGCELAEDFFAEMPGTSPPPGWGSMSTEERRIWFARKKAMRKDARFVDAWQWWRARRAALIVRRIKEELGEGKALWAFTLTWDKGWHHGQDPVMMNDAGVDADALMLYEADAEQFEQMMREWGRYVGRRDAQLVVGDVVDWPLHQRSPRGPGEFGYRMRRAMEGVYGDGPAAGIFVHDLARALGGRLGPYSTMDWMLEARAAARRFRELPDDAPPAAAAARRPRRRKTPVPAAGTGP